MLVLELGDIERFASAKRVASYVGLSGGLEMMAKKGSGPGVEGSLLPGATGGVAGLFKELRWAGPKGGEGSVAHVLIGDAVRAVAAKLHESPESIQAAYWIKVQPDNPWTGKYPHPMRIAKPLVPPIVGRPPTRGCPARSLRRNRVLRSATNPYRSSVAALT